ncbi:hypothetical protein ACQP2T_04165 [Nonomuraea sp. CA-143628]|uniref:hypothetical protein n=1 Tax=Nonomuraea sp. CA-143628 TaxID=3239997 RepID=UPI003D8BA722
MSGLFAVLYSSWSLPSWCQVLGPLRRPRRTRLTADLTSAITAGTAGFFLMSRIKEPATAYFNGRSEGSGQPTLRLTPADGSVKSLTATHGTHLQAVSAASTVLGDDMQARDEGTGPFTGETRKVYLQFDLVSCAGNSSEIFRERFKYLFYLFGAVFFHMKGRGLPFH